MIVTLWQTLTGLNLDECPRWAYSWLWFGVAIVDPEHAGGRKILKLFANEN